MTEVINLGRDGRTQKAIEAYAAQACGPRFDRFYGVVTVIPGTGDVGTLGLGPRSFTVSGMSVPLGWLCCGSKHLGEHNVVAHELGHALGLPHSFGPAGPGINAVNMDLLGWLDSGGGVRSRAPRLEVFAAIDFRISQPPALGQ